MVKVQQLIISTEQTLGDGKSQDSPIRAITKVCDFEGNEIARNDPQGGYTLEDLIEVAKYFSRKEKITFSDGAWHNLLNEVGIRNNFNS